VRGKINFKFKIHSTDAQDKFSNFKLKSGFTLLEIIIVLAVIMTLFAGLLPLFLNIITVNKSAEYYSKAYKILDSKMEEYRSNSFDSLVTGNFTVTDLPSGQGTLTVTNNVDGAPQTDIKKLDLIISWTFKKQNQVRIITYVARNGIKR